MIAAADVLELPFADPVLIVAAAFLIFLIAPAVMERLRVPGLVGLILAGAIVGPNGLDLLARDATIVLLGTVGLLYLMFMAGVEIDLHGFRRYRNRSLVFGALTFLIPQGLGTGVGLLLGYPLPTSILLASLFASHTLLAYPIATRFGIAKTQAVTTAVGGTIITDTAALLVLAVIAASTEGALTAAFWLRLVIGLAIYTALVLMALPRLGRWLFRHEQTGANTEYVFLLAALFAGSFLAEVAGVEAIVGAFLVGLALNPLIPEHGPLASRIHFVGEAIFIPFFLLSVGMLVDVRVLMGGTRVWQVMLGMTATVLVAKWIAARLTQQIFGYTPEEGWTIFGLTVPQAAATLAATLIGYEIGLFDDAVLNGAILMILVTAIVGPWLVSRYGRLVALQEEQRPYSAAEAPRRTLVPLANPATADALLDLALAVRETGSPEPVFPMTVVRPEAQEAGAAVAAAEKMLSHAVAYAAAANVPVVPMTRVDHNVASGIARGVAERRATSIIIGWDARQSRRRGIFGGVLDQLLEQTREQVLIARLGHPLSTTRRLVVVVSRGADRMPGFHETARSVKLLANRLGASILGLAVDSEPDAYRDFFDAIKPDAPATFDRIAGWDALSAQLTRHLEPDDLVVVVGARAGALAWDPALDRLPMELAESAPGSFIMVYPSELERPAPPPGGEAELPPGLLPPERILRDIPPQPFADVIRAVLGTAFGHSPQRLEQVAELLIRHERTVPGEVVPGEVVPGVVLLHGHLRDLSTSMMCLGISPEGVEFPGVSAPARLVFILLSPVEQPEQHLGHLAAIARWVSNPSNVRTLLTGS